MLGGSALTMWRDIHEMKSTFLLAEQRIDSRIDQVLEQYRADRQLIINSIQALHRQVYSAAAHPRTPQTHPDAIHRDQRPHVSVDVQITDDDEKTPAE